MSGAKPEDIDSYRVLIKEIFSFCTKSGYRGRNLQQVVNNSLENESEEQAQIGSIKERINSKNPEIYELSSCGSLEKPLKTSGQLTNEIIRPDFTHSQGKNKDSLIQDSDTVSSMHKSQSSDLKHPIGSKMKNHRDAGRISLFNFKQLCNRSFKMFSSPILFILRKMHLL